MPPIDPTIFGLMPFAVWLNVFVHQAYAWLASFSVIIV
jgi:hypothetical protein